MAGDRIRCRTRCATSTSGKMDGFVATAESGLTEQQRARPGAGHDVMGYHDATEIPNYWQYARQFVLQDHMFAPLASWSLPEHLSLVSAWSALCSRRDDPMSCKDAPHASISHPTSSTGTC